jgi:hypothetical protein
MINILVDVMDIPKTMDNYLGVVWIVANLITPLIFAAAIANELHNAAEGQQPDYRGVIWTTVLVVFANLIYRVWFMKIVALCEHIGMSVLTYQDWVTLMTIMSQKQQEIGVVGLFSIDVSGLLLNIALTIAIITEEVFNLVRFMFLSVLYLIGPIVVASAIYKPIRLLFKGWILSVVQVSFWIVVLRIFQAAILSFNVSQLISDGNLAVTTIVTLTFILACFLAPAFTSKLFSGQNIGLLGSTVIAGMSFITTKIATAKWIPTADGKKTNVFGAATHVVRDTASFVGRTVSKVVSPKVKEETEATEEKRIR